MQWLAGGFVFRRTDSAYHRIDPRVKLLVSILLFAAALVARSVFQMLPLLIFMFGVSGVAHIFKRVCRTLALTAVFAIVIFAVNLFFYHSLATSLLFSSRFLAVVMSTSLFFITTSPDELEQVMKWFRLPRDLVFAFSTAVRFVPVMMLDALQIMDAQKSRGLEMQKGNVFGRVRNMIPVLVPLVVNSVIRSGELAEAMESRAYGAVPKPTSLMAYRARPLDVAIALLALALFAVAVYAFYFLIPAGIPP